MSTVIRQDRPHILNPTTVAFGKHTIVQDAILRLFPRANAAHLELSPPMPGIEIMMFHTVLLKNIGTGLNMRDDRGVAIEITEGVANAIAPSDDLVTALIRSLAISYEKASRKNIELKNAIIGLNKTALFIQPSSLPDEQKSFMYDGYVVTDPRTGKAIKAKKTIGAKLILHKALTRAKEAILSQEIIGLDILTPAEIQNEMVENITKNLKTRIVESGEDWKLELTAPVRMDQMYSVAMNLNRAYLRATHSSMIIPDSSPYKIVKDAENIGKKLSRTLDLDSFLEVPIDTPEIREYAAKEETPLSESSSIRMARGATGFEMKSMFTFGGTRPVLKPVS